jgi:hypothetical protein
MYAYVLDIGRGYFEGVCAPSDAGAYSRAPPPPPRSYSRIDSCEPHHRSGAFRGLVASSEDGGVVPTGVRKQVARRCAERALRLAISRRIGLRGRGLTDEPTAIHA